MSYADLKKNEFINAFIRQADESLAALGYTEHSFAHVNLVSSRAASILATLGYPDETVELVKVSGYLHDIGNAVNRTDHSQSGALLAFHLLKELGYSPDNIARIVCAIGNHDEGTGVPVSPMAAALILADKSDVRRNRVRNQDFSRFDIHDRVNYSVTESDLIIDKDSSSITLKLHIDTEYSSVMDFFEIFMARLKLCKSAAEFLNMHFILVINDQRLL